MMKQYLLFISFFLLFGCNESPEINGTDPVSPIDAYVGDVKEISLVGHANDFEQNEFVCYLRAEDNSIIKRSGTRTRSNDVSNLTFDVGLSNGVYRLLYFEYETPDCERSETAQYGLGCRVEISDDVKSKILDIYSDKVGLAGYGTKSDPFIVCCYQDLETLRDITNDQQSNNLLRDSTYFSQVCDIDMDLASWNSHHQYGWLPIGSQGNNPFRGIYDGNGYEISGLWSSRVNSPAIGLFGYVEGSSFTNINMVDPRMEGCYGVAPLIGSTIVSGENHDKITYLNKCKTEQGSVTSGEGAIGTGGLVGVVDMYSRLLIYDCENVSTEVSGAYAVGGILGAGTLYSSAYIALSKNNADVTSYNTGAGGLVGSADSVVVLSCLNRGRIDGSTQASQGASGNSYIGAGGLVGGAGVTYVYSSHNEGDISGYEGVGGLIGSTRTGAESQLIYNTAAVSYGKNSGHISGYNRVGGLCGEGQFGCYGSLNSGQIEASYARASLGGIVGHSSLSVIYNAVNNGKVTAPESMAIGGIVGQATVASLYADQNFGEINTTANDLNDGDGVGGIVGLSGNYTMLNYCSNMGKIINEGTSPTGGLIGEVGDPREWSGLDIAHCVIGSVECVLGFMGPTISEVGESLHFIFDVPKTLTEAFVILTEFAHGAAMVTDSFIYMSSLTHLLSPAELAEIETEFRAHTSDYDQELLADISNVRNQNFMPSGNNNLFNSSSYSDFNRNVAKTLDFFELSEENNELVNLNINLKREERFEEIEKNKESREIVQSVITGATIVASGILFVGGIIAEVVSAGTATPIIIAGLTTFVSVIGGVNAIIEGATDYENNAVVISQSMNLGDIYAENSVAVGGLCGVGQDYSWFKDCLNAGSCQQKNLLSGGIVGTLSSRGELTNCLQLGSGWSHPFVDKNKMTVSSGLYYHSELAKEPTFIDDGLGSPLYKESMNKDYSFRNFEFEGENPLWSFGELNNLNHPIPFHSEMEGALE